ncbi:MAG: hypothetical protein IT337_09885 [Thermomicrobiales bacterium]|nr:hypothetical protein [Thermomicrobiales bacterium]
MPAAEARRLGIPRELYEDYANLVLVCSGCNGFDNRHWTDLEPRTGWTQEEFFALRDELFAQRFARIAARQEWEMAFFEGRPWETGQGEA